MSLSFSHPFRRGHNLEPLDAEVYDRFGLAGEVQNPLDLLSVRAGPTQMIVLDFAGYIAVLVGYLGF